jgi:hypothetical protein
MYNEQQRGWSPITRPSINNTIKGYMGMSVTFTLVELAASLAGWLSHVRVKQSKVFLFVLESTYLLDAFVN